jgi:dienelactone hydrolase
MRAEGNDRVCSAARRAAGDAPARAPSTMVPLYFGPQERPLFGAYHPPRAAGHRPAAPPVRDAGVVIVNPFGHEELHAHRAQRHLADQLAEAGFPALRFDLDATGDSAGDDREAGRVAAWRASLVEAATALRAKAGVSKVVLVGLRAGALLALFTAAEVGADRLVLWNPVSSGRMHARELLRLHKMLFPKPKAEGAAPEDEEALGFVLRKDTAEALGKLDPQSLTERPTEACLVIGGNESPTEDKLLDRLRGLGMEVEYRHLPGHPFLVTDPHRSDVPNEMLAAIVEYLASKYPVSGDAPAPREEATPAIVTGGPGGEEAWHFGAPRPRFGVLTPPKERRDRPAIVLMNAGSIHHIGPNRSFVRMARRWAELGYPVLRMDLSGIGESPVGEVSAENVPYPHDAVKDAQAAMTALEKEGVARRFILVGLCSGADIAFRAGVIDRRVCGAWMINPQAFYFESSDALKLFLDAELQAQYYESNLWDLERWKKMARGEVDLLRVAGILRTKVETTVRRRLARFLGGAAKGTKPEARDVIADLRSMASRGADTLLLCSEDDPGLVYLMKYFGKGLGELSGVRGFRREVVKGTDHTFTPVWSQDLLSDMLTQHLLKQHPVG